MKSNVIEQACATCLCGGDEYRYAKHLCDICDAADMWLPKGNGEEDDKQSD